MEIKSGGQFTCALLAGSAQLKCWGANNYGQLGAGSEAVKFSVPSLDSAVDVGARLHVVDFCTGAQHGCAILSNGGVKCWGANLYGQLGLGSNVSHTGSKKSEMGDALAFVRLPQAASPAMRVACGSAHSCVIGADNHVYCWGKSDVLGWQYNASEHSANAAWGDEAAEMGENLKHVQNARGGATVTAVVAGENFGCVLRDDERVLCWGAGWGAQAVRVALPQDTGSILHVVAGSARHGVCVSRTASTYCAKNVSEIAVPALSFGGVDVAGGETAASLSLGEKGLCMLMVYDALALNANSTNRGNTKIQCYNGSLQSLSRAEIGVHRVYAHEEACVPCIAGYFQAMQTARCNNVTEWARLRCGEGSGNNATHTCMPCVANATCDGGPSPACAYPQTWRADTERCEEGPDMRCEAGAAGAWGACTRCSPGKFADVKGKLLLYPPSMKCVHI
jgi:hypothetical protein